MTAIRLSRVALLRHLCSLSQLEFYLLEKFTNALLLALIAFFQFVVMYGTSFALTLIFFQGKFSSLVLAECSSGGLGGPNHPKFLQHAMVLQRGPGQTCHNQSSCNF